MSRMNQLNLAEDEAAKIKEEILHKEGENLRKKRKKISIFDFEPLKIIGKGAFGEVRVCKYIPNGSIVAIKKMKKEEMHKKNQVLYPYEYNPFYELIQLLKQSLQHKI